MLTFSKYRCAMTSILKQRYMKTMNELTKMLKFYLKKHYDLFFSAFKSLNLLQSVTSTVNQVCRKLKIDEKTFKSVKSGRVIPHSVHAVKNGRRKMEDRHVLIHDLNAIYCDSNVRKLIIKILNFNAHIK